MIGADLVVSKHGRWLGVRDGDIKVVQTLGCKYKSENADVSEKLIFVSIKVAKNTRIICEVKLKCGYSLNITATRPECQWGVVGVSHSLYATECILWLVHC